MVPVFALGNELMRHHLFYPAVERYQQVMEEHCDTEEAIQAHFMLGLALREAGDIANQSNAFPLFSPRTSIIPLAGMPFSIWRNSGRT